MLVLLVCSMSGKVQAQEVKKMLIQGVLKNLAGEVVTNTLSMKFRIYDAETDGNLKWGTDTGQEVSKDSSR